MPPTFHGGTGLLDFGTAGESYYYSRTRMPANGVVTVGTTSYNVSGQVWFDHQWGDFESTQLSWDWFALQLSDGSDIMFYQLRDANGRPFLDSGTLTQNGRTTTLTAADFQSVAQRRWTSPRTGIEYPIEWLVRLPNLGLDLRLTPVIDHSEFDARSTTFNAYWEGAVRIEGDRSGVGFVELGGYQLIVSNN